MPASLDRCVSSLTAKWKEDPSSRPKSKEGQDAKSQAFAICTAAEKRSKAKSLEIMLEDGYGPVLIGAAATNRPYIPRLEETRIEEISGEKKLIVHLANPGFFNHPTGAFTLNHAVFSTMTQNFDDRVVGQREAYDCRHQPNLGAFGWFEKLSIRDKKLYGQVDPTPVGLEQIENKMYLYSSMEFHRNYKRDDVRLDLEDATENFCVLDLDNYVNELDRLGYRLEGESGSVEKFIELLEGFVAGDKEFLDFGKVSGSAPRGFAKVDGNLILAKPIAKIFLKALESTKAELDDYVYQLFNPYHSKEDGKFTTKEGGRGIAGVKKSIKGKWEGLTPQDKLNFKVAGAAFTAAATLAIARGVIMKQMSDMSWSAVAQSSKGLPDWYSKPGGRESMGQPKYSEDNMSDEERVKLEQELEEERERREADVKALEKERDEAMDRAIRLEQEATDSAVASIIELSKDYRDKDGLGMPKQFIEWVGKVLKFEDFGEDDNVVRLSEDNPGAEMVKYLTGAVKALILSMPGTVPTQRKSKDGSGGSEEFDFDDVWDNEGEGD